MESYSRSILKTNRYLIGFAKLFLRTKFIQIPDFLFRDFYSCLFCLFENPICQTYLNENESEAKYVPNPTLNLIRFIVNLVGKIWLLSEF